MHAGLSGEEALLSTRHSHMSTDSGLPLPNRASMPLPGVCVIIYLLCVVVYCHVCVFMHSHMSTNSGLPLPNRASMPMPGVCLSVYACVCVHVCVVIMSLAHW